MNSEKLTLGYWKIRGLGARVRLLLQYTGTPYQEEFYTPENRQHYFNVIKPELIKKNPCVTLPYLKDGEKLDSESDGCMISVIHKSGKVELLGRNAEEQVNVTTIMGVFRDLYKSYLEFIYGPQKDKTFQDIKPVYFQKFKPFLTKFNSFIGEKNFYCGDITYVDFVIAEFVQHLNILEPGLFQNDNKNVLNHQKRVWELPAIKSYVESDRWIQRPVNYVLGRWV